MEDEIRKYLCLDCEHIGWTRLSKGCKECQSHNLSADQALIEAQIERKRLERRRAARGVDMFPWDQVDSARKDQLLQRRHSIREARMRYEWRAEPCPKCNKMARELSWFYFSTPRWTWDNLCGRAGWMVVCDECHCQVSFFRESMN
jgi:hypothetical protein